MINKIKNLILELTEETKYHDSVVEAKKSLESTLWGLEEQASFPENSGSVDQNEIIEGINKCRQKINNCNKLITSHEKKLVEHIKKFNQQEGCSSCSAGVP